MVHDVRSSQISGVLFGGTGEFYAACGRLHLIRPLRGHLPLKGKAVFACGRDGRRETPYPSASLTPSPQGEGLEGCVIQHREPLKGKAWGQRVSVFARAKTEAHMCATGVDFNGFFLIMEV